MNIRKPFWLFAQVLALGLLLGGLVNASATSAEACWQCRLDGSIVYCGQGGNKSVCYVTCGGGSICSCTSGGDGCRRAQEEQRRQLEAVGKVEGALPQ